MLPVRNGVGPSCVGLPPGRWPSLLDFLMERFPGVARDEWQHRMAAGEVVDEQGQILAPDQCYRPHTRVYYYRSLPDELPNPAHESVLFEDDLLVVADKPHYLPVTPTGKYLQQTLLVRLRCKLGIDGLTPLHRIDRETAGLVLFAKQPATIRHYAAMFATQRVTKCYEAIAPRSESLSFPLTRTSSLVEAQHFMQMRESDGVASAHTASTTIDRLEVRGALARYRLQPHSGKRHQLRVHMAALGLPIVGDRIYPQLQPEGTDDLSNPLRLLAQTLAFDDPVTGQARHFQSDLALEFP